MSDENSEQKQPNNSRRKFLKAGAIAGGAAVIGLSLGLPGISANSAPLEVPPATDTPNTSTMDPQIFGGDNQDWNGSSYKPQERWYFLYATDGIVWVPTDQTGIGANKRPIYMYGFAKPVSDTKVSGWSKGNVGAANVGPPGLADLRQAFADMNWIDPNTHQPVMRGKARIIGPPIWGVEGDILDIAFANLGFAFPSGVTDPHTVHLHGVHAPNYYDGIPEISFGVPMWNPYPMDASGSPTIPTSTAPATFTPATDTNLTPGVQGGNVFTYRMYCERPGTYMYHCHVEASEHVQMGMSGPLWIYPRTYGHVNNGGAAYNNSLTKFDQEAFVFCTDIDSRWHDSILDMSFAASEPNPFTDTFGPAVATGPNANPAAANFQIPDFRPDYLLVNGRCLPFTLLAGKYTQGFQPGLLSNPTVVPPAHILNSLAMQLTYYPSSILKLAPGSPGDWPTPPLEPVFVPRQPMQTYIQTSVSEKILARLVLMGYHDMAMHFHGVMPTTVGKDTFAWVPQLMSTMFGTSTDQRKRQFTIALASGETYDNICVYPDKAAISPTVYGFIKNANAGPMPYSTSEVGIPPSPPFGTNADYGDIVHVADPSIPMVLGPGAINPVNGNPSAGPGLPASSGDGTTATGYAKTGYPLFYLWHDHDDYLVTNNGAYPGGAVTVVKLMPQGTTKALPSIIKSFINP
jgi:manganese oxidase